jgi:choline dehydrogenase-like flavoprotein
MRLYPRLGAIAVLLHDHTRGRLELEETGPPSVSYRLGGSDEDRLMDALEKASEISFAAGAEKVFLPYNDVVTIAKRGDYQPIRDRGVRMNDPLFLSYQPQGTLRMGSDRRKSVVDPHGEAHAIAGLFVSDASVFPTSISVPAQLTVMALASRTAQHITERADKYF